MPSRVSAEQTRLYCENLECGEILLVSDSSSLVCEADRNVLTQVSPSDVAHKNVSYDPATGRVRGLRGGHQSDDIRAALQRYNEQVVKFCAGLLAPYGRSWRIDLSSFRSLDESGRILIGHQRNDLLHIDAFPSRPTNGARILRFFTNIHPSRARVWITSETLETLAEHSTRISEICGEVLHSSFAWRHALRILASAARAVRINVPDYSPYDRFMLRLHDTLKADADYQKNCAKTRCEFAPNSSWLVFSDAVPHAVLEGQFALEQTFLVPRNALLLPDRAPAAIAERLAGRRMTY